MTLSCVTTSLIRALNFKFDSNRAPESLIGYGCSLDMIIREKEFRVTGVLVEFHGVAHTSYYRLRK